VLALVLNDARPSMPVGETVARWAPAAFDASVFDASVFAVWCCLCRGGRLVVPP
jgi:hypothetical protein